MSLRCLLAPPTSPPLTSLVDAVVLVQLLALPAPEPEVYAVLLDLARRPLLGLGGAADAVGLPEITTAALTGGRRLSPDAVLLASVHTGPLTPEARDRLPETWCELDDLCAEAGVELAEWLVVTPTRVLRPRELLGAPARLGGAAVPPG
jgi:hypothetical protein